MSDPDLPSSPSSEADLSALGRALLDGITGAGRPDPVPWQPPSAEELQKLLPQYEISRLLGRGGMGAVYQGRQISLDRSVAIKILSSQLEEASAGFAERFKNEARAMAKLSHPGIVSVHDSGGTGDGLLYIVMEFIEGTDVHKMIAASGRLHTEHAIAITAHVCDALQYAHDRDIIHRDIKPANVMVGYDGAVKVADFGLAKINKAGETAGLTQSGMAMGTLHYMAPEALVLGSSVDHRADVYAVGVMLYHMLVGKVPHGMFELPSQQVPGLDPRFDGIIARAMREDRDQRYQNARDLRAALDAILTQPVVKADPEAAKAIPAALPTAARPKRPSGQVYSPPGAQPPRQPQAGTPVKKKSPVTAWVLSFVLITALGTGAFLAFKKTAPRSGGTPAAGSSPSATPGSAPPASAPAAGVPPLPVQAKKDELWTPFLDKPEDFGPNAPLELRDGWVTRKEGAISGTMATSPEIRDGAIRADCIGPGCRLILRYGGKFYYSLTRTTTTLELFRNSDLDTPKITPLQKVSVPVLGPEEPFTLELRAVGSVITGSLNGKELLRAEDSRYTVGRMGIALLTPESKARKIALLILDGSPESGGTPLAGSSPAPATGIKIDDAFMKANVLGTSWRTHYTNDSRHDTLEFKSTGNEVVKTASVGGQQQGRWSIGEDGTVLKVDTLDGSGFYFLITFTSGGTAGVQFVKVKTPSMVGSMSKMDVPAPVPVPPAPGVAATPSGQQAPAGAFLGVWRQVLPVVAGQNFEVQLFAGQKAVFTGGKQVQGTWRLEAGVLKIAWENGSRYEFPSAGTASTGILEGARMDREGMSVPLRLEKRGAATTPADTFNGHRYQFVPGLFTWEEARTKAGSMGGHLATITAGEEDAWVVKTIASKLTQGQMFWIGARQEKPDQPWRWVTGEDFSYTQWAAGEPNNAQAKTAKGTPPFLLAYTVSDRSGWNDLSESDPRWRGLMKGCLVEWDDPPPAASPPLPVAGASVWIDTKGRTLVARFVRLEGGNVLLEISGSVRPVAMNTLSEESQRQARELQAAAPSPAASIPPATKDQPYVNSLGMKFVPVPETTLLFCIHETRYKDYAAYAAEVPGVDAGWKDQSADGFTPTGQTEDHPVVRVSWEDARKFCAWLSQKDPGCVYRLPTDAEWSMAVGVGRDEQWRADTTPATVFTNPSAFPWGDQWPPPKGSGNYSDESRHARAPGFNSTVWLHGYDDGFPTTAPVMSCTPSNLGLYDMGGNVWEWVEDWYDSGQKERVLRGGSWSTFNGRDTLLSSSRSSGIPGFRGHSRGFRCVLVRPPTPGAGAAAPAAAAGPGGMQADARKPPATGWQKLASDARCNARDVAIRARFKVGEPGGTLTVRGSDDTATPKSKYWCGLAAQGDELILFREWRNPGPDDPRFANSTLARTTLRTPIKRNQEYTLTFMAVGDLLRAYIDDELVIELKDTLLPGTYAGRLGQEKVKDLEWMPLSP